MAATRTPPLALAGALLLGGACARPPERRELPPEGAEASAPPATPGTAPSPPPSPRPTVPVSVDEVPVPGDLPMYVLRGARAQRMKAVFVPGMCVHPQGYAQAFAFAAADRGELVALQGDRPCGGNRAFRYWSNDLGAMYGRIERAFAVAGLGEVRDVTLIGYSQGAERAEHLAARYPDRFSRVVLIASPIVPSPVRLRAVTAAAFLAGTRDRQNNMRDGLRAFIAAGERATFLALPGAAHGQMGVEAERVMGEALDFVLAP